MKRSNLKGRLERLERKRKVRTFARRVYGIDNRLESEVTGVEAGGIHVLRQPGETIAALYERAFAMTGAFTLATLYSARQAAPQAESASPRYPDGQTAPEDAPRPVPGVGVKATREQLIRLGAIRLPAELMPDW